MKILKFVSRATKTLDIHKTKIERKKKKKLVELQRLLIFIKQRKKNEKEKEFLLRKRIKPKIVGSHSKLAKNLSGVTRQISKNIYSLSLRPLLYIIIL